MDSGHLERITMSLAGSPSRVQFQLKEQITHQPGRKNLLRLHR